MQACRDALALAPERADLWTMLGGHAAALGHFEEASGYHRRALDIDPNCTEARRELVSIRQGEQTAEERAALSAVLADSSRAVRDRIAAGFALGAEYERAGDIDRAFGAFADANRLARAEAVAAGKGFDAAAMRGSVDWLVRTFGPAAFARTIGWGDPAEVPVFVVGMPRSGTTLVEQIASSHTQVFGAGERMDIPRIIDVLMGGDSSRTPDRWDPVAVRREALAYVERLRKLDGAALRVIDKLPDNIQSLGQIAILFPRARVIICRRDLRDVCLSCHTQRFADSLPWTHDLADCAVRAREIERLVAHWTAVLPLRMLEVGYETLVGDLEGESRRIIDFLGLPWDPACLAFHRTERSVLTASRWQVRQPLYSSSVGRWRMYRRHLGPLLAGLKGLVAEDD
jgi:tetratricopeptide (TPR) repeat protein